MGLNSKKSWHPGKAINRAKVQVKEHNELTYELESEKKLEELRHERELEKLRLEATNNSEPRKASKLSWMYNSPNTINTANNSDVHAALYGDSSNTPATPNAVTVRNKSSNSASKQARKQAADPLYKIIKLRQQRLSSRIHRSDTRKRA